MEGRVQQLEQTVTTILDRQQQLLEKLTEFFQRLPVNEGPKSLQEEGEASNTVSRVKYSRRGLGLTNLYAPRLVKLNFPRFNGAEDPTSWLCEAEQFFQFHNTLEEEKVALASFHLEGEAQLWYYLLKQEDKEVTWQEFKEGLYSCYGPTQFFDPFGELTKLQ